MKNKLPPPKIDRWSEGVDHEPESDILARLIGDMDFEHFGDQFCLKFGGDLNNYEELSEFEEVEIESVLDKPLK